MASVGPSAFETEAQTRPRPAPETYHWVLPADQSGVEVTRLHPNDCYVIQRATGTAYFGELSAGVIELQRQLATPYAHRVDAPGEHPECGLGSCLKVTAIASAIAREVESLSAGRLLRAVDHRPSPLDHWFGGAYTDVGSDGRDLYRNTPEQRMLFRHLSTSSRGHCYEAKAPRTISIHVRDQEKERHPAGVYSGYLYIEHHHSVIAGDRVVARAGE